MAEFRMPSLGADMDAGTLVAWHAGVGDHVARGDVVAEVDTDKSVIDVETFVTGTVEQLLVEEGARVPVGTPLAVIREDSEVSSPDRSPAPVSPSPTAPTASPVPAPVTTPPSVPLVAPPPAPPSGAASARSTRRPPSSPLARRHAERLGVDLAAVTGTGPGGAITTRDVDRHAAEHERPAARGPSGPAVTEPPAAPPTAPPTEPPAGRTRPLAGAERQESLRRAVAASMARSKREIPHYYLAADIDLAAAVHWLDDHNARVPVTARVLPVALLLKATALALHESPDLNGFWEADMFHPERGVHLGVAIALRGGGLVAPALLDADHLTVPELQTALRELVGRARSGRLRSSEASGATITVTSLGDQGVDVVQPVIYPPQVAIVGFGRIRPRPWAVDGMLTVRPVVTVTLAADHRVTDGHRGAVLLTAIDHLLQEPEAL